MRCANGFAIGNGRATGVLGTPEPDKTGALALDEVDEEPELDDDAMGSGVMSMMSSSEVSSDVGGGISSLGSGGIGGSAVEEPSRDGRDAAGDGGGSTNEFVSSIGDGGGGSSMLVLNSGNGLEGEGGMAGITSVSYAGRTFCVLRGESTTPSPDDRRDTRVFRALATFDFTLRGDLRGEGLGSIAAGTDIG